MVEIGCTVMFQQMKSMKCQKYRLDPRNIEHLMLLKQGLTANLGMRDRIKQLEVRRVYKTCCDDLMLCLMANNIRLNWKLACQARLVARELTVASHTGHSSGTMSNQQEAERNIECNSSYWPIRVKSVAIENNESECETLISLLRNACSNLIVLSPG
jgi:hypothetical protein